MKVTIHNDGKEKHNSYEARLDDIQLIGLGSTKEYAIADLKRLVKGLVATLRNVDYDNIELVDWEGYPIKSGAV